MASPPGTISETSARRCLAPVVPGWVWWFLTSMSIVIDDDILNTGGESYSIKTGGGGGGGGGGDAGLPKRCERCKRAKKGAQYCFEAGHHLRPGDPRPVKVKRPAPPAGAGGSSGQIKKIKLALPGGGSGAGGDESPAAAGVEEGEVAEAPAR